MITAAIPNPYQLLKTRLLKTYAPTDTVLLSQLLAAVELGDRRPTDMMNTMLSQLRTDEPAGKLFLPLCMSRWRPSTSPIPSSWPSTRIPCGRPSCSRLSLPPSSQGPNRVQQTLSAAAVLRAAPLPGPAPKTFRPATVSPWVQHHIPTTIPPFLPKPAVLTRII